MVEHNVNFGKLGHGGDWVADPIGRCDGGIIEAEFFVEGHADTHDRATFDSTLQLERVDDDPGINNHGDLIDFDGADGTIILHSGHEVVDLKSG